MHLYVLYSVKIIILWNFPENVQLPHIARRAPGASYQGLVNNPLDNADHYYKKLEAAELGYEDTIKAEPKSARTSFNSEGAVQLNSGCLSTSGQSYINRSSTSTVSKTKSILCKFVLQSIDFP